MYGEPGLGVDLTDLIRGEGDWRNMQDVVRRAFRSCLETQQKQTEKIAVLSSQMMSMKDELTRRPTWEDMERLVESKMMSSRVRGPSSGALQGGVEDLRMEISHIKANLETKVNLRAVESMLSKKVDRSDMAIRTANDMGAGAMQRDLRQLHETVANIQSRVATVETETQRMSDDNDFHQQKRDLLVMRTQIENIYRSMGDFHTKDHVKHLLDQKVGHSELPALLGGKADGERVHATLAALEAAMERHEKQLTSLRLSAHDPSVFREEAKSLNKPVWSSKQRSSKPSDQSINESRSAGREFEDLMRDGRIETMLSKVYQQMSDLGFAHEQLLQQIEGLEKGRRAMQEQLNLSANKQAVELLAVVVEEQRLRVDSVIQGSVRIKPIYKDLKRLEAELQQVHAFVQLPSQRTFKETVDGLQQRIQDTSDHVHALHSTVHEQCIPTQQSAKSRLDLIETIWQAYEVDRDRLQYLVSVVDFADTPYSNMREVGRSIAQLYFLIQGDPLLNQLSDKEAGIVAQSHGCLFNRMRDAEEEGRRLQQQVAGCQRALLAVKAVLNTDGKASEALKTFGSSSTPSSASSQSFTLSERGVSPGSPTRSSPAKKKMVTVDFDAALGQLLSSLDDVAVPTKSVRGDSSAGQPWSLSGIDERLAQLSQQKQELRKKLLSEV